MKFSCRFPFLKGTIVFSIASLKNQVEFCEKQFESTGARRAEVAKCFNKKIVKKQEGNSNWPRPEGPKWQNILIPKKIRVSRKKKFATFFLQFLIFWERSEQPPEAPSHSNRKGSMKYFWIYLVILRTGFNKKKRLIS